MNLPFRMLIIGGSGAGKTQTLMNMIRIMNGTFNNIHIITKNKDEPLYNYLKSKVDNGLTITEGIESAPNFDEFDKKRTKFDSYGRFSSREKSEAIRTIFHISKKI